MVGSSWIAVEAVARHWVAPNFPLPPPIDQKEFNDLPTWSLLDGRPLPVMKTYSSFSFPGHTNGRMYFTYAERSCAMSLGKTTFTDPCSLVVLWSLTEMTSASFNCSLRAYSLRVISDITPGIWNLTVNLDKTKIVIFSKGKIRKFGKFLFGGEKIEVVPDYTFLGVVMNYNNKFTKAINRQTTLAKRAMFSLNSKINSLNLPIDLQLDVFKKLVIPVITYGCEIWGFENIETVERMQRNFLKNAICSGK